MQMITITDTDFSFHSLFDSKNKNHLFGGRDVRKIIYLDDPVDFKGACPLLYKPQHPDQIVGTGTICAMMLTMCFPHRRYKGFSKSRTHISQYGFILNITDFLYWYQLIFLLYFYIMKHLSDSDIAKMIDTDFQPDETRTRHVVRTELRLGQLIPSQNPSIPERIVLDLHYKTEEQAWNKIMELAKSGVRNATIITGASGILKIKFQQWANDSVLSPYIISVRPINNGSFDVKFRKKSEPDF